MTVAASGGDFQEMMLIGEDPIGFAQVLSAPPWQFTIQLPSDISPGRYALRVNGDTGVGDDITSSPISIDVERSDAPAGISVSLPAMDLRVGDTGYPRVSATYSDGSTLDVTESGQVSYQSDTPGVATVINDGRVTAVGPGSANISINYGDISIQVPVTVKPPLTIVPAVSSIYVGQTERLYAPRWRQKWQRRRNLRPGWQPQLGSPLLIRRLSNSPSHSRARLKRPARNPHTQSPSLQPRMSWLLPRNPMNRRGLRSCGKFSP